MRWSRGGLRTDWRACWGATIRLAGRVAHKPAQPVAAQLPSQINPVISRGKALREGAAGRPRALARQML